MLIDSKSPDIHPILLSELPHCDMCDRTYMEAFADEIFYQLPESSGLILCSGCLAAHTGSRGLRPPTAMKKRRFWTYFEVLDFDKKPIEEIQEGEWFAPADPPEWVEYLPVYRRTEEGDFVTLQDGIAKVFPPGTIVIPVRIHGLMPYPEVEK